MGTYSVTVETALVQSIFLHLPEAARWPSPGTSPATFLPDATDPSKGTLTVDGQFEAVVGQIMAIPDLQAAQLISYTAQVRYNLMTGGVTINGTSILTDPSSQNLINGAVNLVTLDTSVQTLDFKSPGGYIELTAAQIITIGKAVGVFIQQCFSAEKAIIAKIGSGAYKTMQDIDGAAEWPNNVITAS